MKALIVYRSKYGAAAECAQKVAGQLRAECDVVDLRDNVPDPAPYDIVVVGGSIYAGRIQRQVRSYCETHRIALQRKIVGCYIACLYKDDKAREELEGNYPDWFKAHAAAAEWFGGRIKLDTMKRIDRFLYVKVAGADKDVSAIQDPRIEGFCRTLNEKMADSGTA